MWLCVPRSVVAALTIISKYQEAYIWGFAYLAVYVGPCMQLYLCLCGAKATSNTATARGVGRAQSPGSLTEHAIIN